MMWKIGLETNRLHQVFVQLIHFLQERIDIAPNYVDDYIRNERFWPEIHPNNDCALEYLDLATNYLDQYKSNEQTRVEISSRIEFISLSSQISNYRINHPVDDECAS